MADRKTSNPKPKVFKPLSGFMMTLVGARRSGKSTLIKKLLKGDLKDRFIEENIFIICPTIDLNDDFADFKFARKFAKPEPELIYDIMAEQKFNLKNYGKARTPEVLIIFDDCADNNILRFGSVMDTLAVRGRHFKINVMVSSQRLRAVSATARDNSDYFVFFSPYNMLELEKFIEEYVLKQDRRETMKKMEQVFEKPYEFIFVDNSERRPTKKIKIGINGKLLRDFVLQNQEKKE